MDSILKVTYIDKESAECTVITEYFILSREDLISVNKEYIQNVTERSTEDLDEKGNVINDNGSNNCLVEQNIFVNKSVKQEIHEHSNTTNCADNNIDLNKTINPLKQNETVSYIKEFDLFLQKYEATYRDCKASYNFESLIPSVNEAEELENSITKNNNFEDATDYTNLGGKSEVDMSLVLISESGGTIRNPNTEDPRNSNNMESITTLVENVKACNSLNTDIKSKYHSDMKVYNNSHKFINIDNINTAIDKHESLFINSEGKDSNISIDEIHIDPSANYTMTSISKTKNDSINGSKEDKDSDGYNSSDFEFIEEEEAYLGGIIDRSGSNNENFSYSNKENKTNFCDPESSKPKSSRRLSRYNSRSSNDSKMELNHHVIPEGELLYELFAEPWVAFNHQAENKAFFSNRAMHLEVNNFGFNVGMLQQRHEENDVNESVKQEAIENAKKIVRMYPIQNKKRRRRH